MSSGPREPLGESLALDQLHHQEAAVALVLEAVERRDVGMVERRQHARLALEARQHVGPRAELGREQLDRDLAPEPAVARAVDLAHAAATEQAEDTVAGEPRSRLEDRARRHPGRGAVGSGHRRCGMAHLVAGPAGNGLIGIGLAHFGAEAERDQAARALAPHRSRVEGRAAARADRHLPVFRFSRRKVRRVRF